MQPGSKATEKRLRLSLLQRDNALQSLQAAHLRIKVELDEAQRQARARCVGPSHRRPPSISSSSSEASAHATDVSARRMRQLQERNNTVTRRAEALQGQVSRLDARVHEVLAEKEQLEVRALCIWMAF